MVKQKSHYNFTHFMVKPTADFLQVTLKSSLKKKLHSISKCLLVIAISSFFKFNVDKVCVAAVKIITLYCNFLHLG